MPQLASLLSEGDDQYAMVDEKKRKRKISNRESARRSRMRREQHIKDLNREIAFLGKRNNEIVQKISYLKRTSITVELENQMLKEQHDKLAKRLESLEIVCSYVCGYQRDIPRCNSQPWQVSHQPLPLITTSVGMLQFDYNPVL
ncbi:bZIP transcription factor 44-like [Diospyros lotus]|uniref:bZIP transcription factor 44-like n=1 Tax=Diospyros lotus TaxID=55363 RepID=UPI002257BF6E|nr:bZIP transcription factor 44-like [Diospyros lotus]